VNATSPLDPSDRIRPVLAATRAVGHDLLVNVGGAAGSVCRLSGGGRELWWYFADGMTIAEAAAELAAHMEASTAEVAPTVEQFAAALVAAHLAEPER